jgi:hypothetical protein
MLLGAARHHQQQRQEQQQQQQQRRVPAVQVEAGVTGGQQSLPAPLPLLLAGQPLTMMAA